MDSCKILRLKSSSCLTRISSAALASSTGLGPVSAQFTGLARVPLGGGSEVETDTNHMTVLGVGPGVELMRGALRLERLLFGGER